MPDPQILLVCTIGGSPEPIAASLRHWKPARVLFVPSRDTAGQVELILTQASGDDGITLGPGQFDRVLITDAQDFAGCVHKMRELATEVQRWLERGPNFKVIIDFTGGTKCMSAALALQAHTWGCTFSYVGGTERTKAAGGTVVSGKETVLHAQNPWAALGYQALDHARLLFDQGGYSPASQLLGQALRSVQEPARKRELTALKQLAEAYDAWDRFDHPKAQTLLAEVPKYTNDLHSLLGTEPGEALLDKVQRHRTILNRLTTSREPTADLVLDLLENARRRGREGRFDDAVARFYRAIEALAQHRLREKHQIASTKEVPLDCLPTSLRAGLAPRVEQGVVSLGLQDAYAFLAEQNDPLGICFRERRLADPERSNLTARNSSILAHGFSPAGEKIYQSLMADVEALIQAAGLNAAPAPSFPRLM